MPVSDEDGIPSGMRPGEDAEGTTLGHAAGGCSTAAAPEAAEPSEAYHLATAALVLNQLSGPDRLRLVAELCRVARTAYVFDVTPSVAGEVGARLIPFLTRLRDAPPADWVHTLERAPTLDEVVRLLPILLRVVVLHEEREDVADPEYWLVHRTG